MSYGPNMRDVFRQAADDETVLEGVRPSDRPVPSPTKLERAITIKTAKGLGPAIPPALLPRADHIVQ
jgi:putative tryptophan/tyrosine transport system substrate-binding protein